MHFKSHLHILFSIVVRMRTASLSVARRTTILSRRRALRRTARCSVSRSRCCNSSKGVSFKTAATSSGMMGQDIPRQRARDKKTIKVNYLILLPTEVLLKILLSLDVVSICRLEGTSNVMNHAVKISGLFTCFPQNSQYPLVRYLGQYLQTNPWFSDCIFTGLSRPRLAKYPLVLQFSLDLMVKTQKRELDQKCQKLKLDIEYLVRSRLTRGYDNCWKECCHRARDLMLLELLETRMRALRLNHPFPRAGMSLANFNYAIDTLLWPAQPSQNRQIILTIMGIFHNRDFKSAGRQLRDTLFRVSLSVKRCYFHVHFPQRRSAIAFHVLRPDLAPGPLYLPNGVKCDTVSGLPMFPPPPAVQGGGGPVIVDIEDTLDEEEAYPDLGEIWIEKMFSILNRNN